MLDVTCPQCNAVYHSEESHAGKHLRCSRCGCLVAISTHAERAVVQQSSASDAASRQGSNPPAKHPTRRIRRVYAAIVFATAVTLLLLLLRFATPKRGTASLSDVEGTKQSQENPNANDTLDFQPGPAQSAEPRPVEYESLATGTRIAKDIGTDGEGKLSVENGWAKVKRAA